MKISFLVLYPYNAATVSSIEPEPSVMMATRLSIVNLNAICGLLNANLPTIS